MFLNLKVLSIRNLLHIMLASLLIGALMGLSISKNMHGWQFLVFFCGLFAVHMLQNSYKQYPIDYIHFCAFPVSKIKIFNMLVMKNFTGIYMFVYILAMISYLTFSYFTNQQISLVEFIVIFEIYILFIVMIVLIQFFCRRSKRFFAISDIGLLLLMLLLLIIVSKDTLNIPDFKINYFYLSLILGVICFLSYIITKIIFLQYVSKIGFKKAVYPEDS